MADKISVCMASYNGKKYISQQIETILQNITINDELIISDDGSTDGTCNIIQDYVQRFPQIQLIRGPQRGVICNFENAIRHASGELIFLADQDDLWTSDKVTIIRQCFADHECNCVIHDAEVIDNKGTVLIPSFFAFRHSKAGVIRNIWKNSYIGCCMAFRKELIPYILPFPDDIHMHDQWIGVLSDYYGHTFFCDRILLHYRRHEGNVTELRHSSFSEMIHNRVTFIREFHKRIKQNKKKA